MKLFSDKSCKAADTDFRTQLFEDMDFVAARLAQIQESFDMTSEPELVDALIYEELAMKARYNYLLRVAKEHNIKCRLTVGK